MLVAILSIFCAFIFLAGLHVALEYNRDYNKRMDVLKLEDDFVQDYLESQESMKRMTYEDGKKFIEAFKVRWENIISKERIEYFESCMKESLEMRIYYNISSN